MILLLDIGNSFVKWAWLDKGGLSQSGRAPRSGLLINELADQCWATEPAARRVLACNVAGEPVAQQVRQWFAAKWDVEATFVQSMPEGFGVANGYTDAGQMGADRWMAIIAARQRFQGNTLVADCGTAITIDFIDAEGVHQGGLIAPGIGMMRECVLKGTAGVATDQGDFQMLGRDTGTALGSGTIQAAAALLDRVPLALPAEHRSGLRCLLTGGNAPGIQPHLITEYTYCPDLVLEGIAIVAGRQKT